MPSVIFDIENSFATITRYVVKSVMEQLMFLTGITNAEIIYNEPLGYGKNAAANSNPNAHALKLDSKDYLMVTYNERYDEQTIDPLANFDEHNLIFLDTKLGVRVRPITSKANIEFNLVYRSKSYNNLAVWLSRFQRNKVVREPHNYHDVLYNYTLPEVIGAYIYDIFHLTQNVAPYPGATLKDYYKVHYTEGLMSRSNASGTKKALAINVNSKNNLGYFTSLPEEINSDKDALIHEITFNYTLTYDKVVELLLEYQIYVHNQRIDTIYDQFFVKENYPKKSTDGKRTFTGFVNTATERLNWYKVEIKDLFLDPIDHWLPTNPLPLTSTMLMAPSQVDPNSIRLVEDINNYPAEKFPATAKEIILFFYQHVTTPYITPFLLELFAVDHEERSIPLTLTNLGILSSTIDLNLRRRHYLRLSIVVDLRRISRDIIKILCEHPDWVTYLLLTINPNAPIDKLTYLNNGLFVTLESLWNVLNDPLMTNNRILTSNNNFNSKLFGYYIEHNVETAQVVIRKGE